MIATSVVGVGRKVTAMKRYRARGYQRYQRKQRSGSRMGSALSLILIVAGLVLVGYFIIGATPFLRAAFPPSGGDEPAAVTDTSLKLTIPKMDRVQDLTVYTGSGDDESALGKGALHLRETGFPWDPEPNVYIAGHRLGYLGTDSYLVFWDLDKLTQGDEVLLTAGDGTRYTYRVFDSFVVGPSDYQVTEPIPGKNIVSLQTCTLPDYTDRIIVQAELMDVSA
jgi:sortase A